MKILIILPIWQRPELTAICTKYLAGILPENYTVLAVLSPEDPFYTKNVKNCIKTGFRTCIYKNKPLAMKINAGIEYSLRFEWDYLMNLGSDDLIHPGIFTIYEPFLAKKELFFGLEKVYFFDKISQQLGISVTHLWGAGRMISREIIEKLKLKGSYLYPEKEERGLDCMSHDRIKTLLHISYVHVPTNDFPYIVDIKSDVGLTDFHVIHNYYTLVDKDLLKKYYPRSVTRLIYE